MKINRFPLFHRFLFQKENHGALFFFITFFLSSLILFVSMLSSYLPEKAYADNASMGRDQFTLEKEAGLPVMGNDDFATAEEELMEQSETEIRSFSLSVHVEEIHRSEFFVSLKNERDCFLVLGEDFPLGALGAFPDGKIHSVEEGKAIYIGKNEIDRNLSTFVNDNQLTLKEEMQSSDQMSSSVMTFTFGSYNVLILPFSCRDLVISQSKTLWSICFSCHIDHELRLEDVNRLQNMLGLGGILPVGTSDYIYLLHPLVTYVTMNLMMPLIEAVVFLVMDIEASVFLALLLSDYLREKKKASFYKALHLLGLPLQKLVFLKSAVKAIFILGGCLSSLLLLLIVMQITSHFTGFFFFADTLSLVLALVLPLLLFLAEIAMESLLIKKIR